MTKEERSNFIKQKSREFIELARLKKYHEESIKVAGMLAVSDDMHRNYGDSPQALDKLIELCKMYDDESEFLGAVLKLAGIEC